MAGIAVQCSWVVHSTLIVPLSTQVYNRCIPPRSNARRHSSGKISQDPSQRTGSPRALFNYILLQQRREKLFVGKEFVFIKDMAYYVKGKFDIFLEEGFKNFKHTFMIRHPEPAVSSLFKLSTNPELAGWDYFDPAEAGFRQLLELYEFIERHVHKDPIVVDADDLLKFPNEIMQSYCEAVGLQFEEHMTSWKPGPAADWVPVRHQYQGLVRLQRRLQLLLFYKENLVVHQDCTPLTNA
ncbi:hypothetical protein ACROYT_G001569 [Oculina patagonica]